MFTPTVLFVCSQNSARSQMSEGWLRHLAGDRYKVYSAGIAATEVNPLAVQAMMQAGVDISDQTCNHTDEYLGKLSVTYLIIVCDRAAEQCPTVWPGVKMRFFWPFPDPASVEGSEEEKLAAFCDVRDQIKHKIENWLSEIEEPQADSPAQA